MTDYNLGKVVCDMLYQETFQSGENPSEINVSSVVYVNGTNSPAESGFPNHCHSFYEIQYFSFGRGESRIDGRRIATVPHSLYLVPPLSVHGQVGHERNVNHVIQFSHYFLSRNASTFGKNLVLKPAGDLRRDGVVMVHRGSELEKALQRIAQISPSFRTPVPSEIRRDDYTPQYEWKLNALTLDVISQLTDTGNLVLEKNAGNEAEITKMQTVLNRLVTCPEEKLGMREAARMAYMSYSNFSRSFAQIIGYSYVDYCNMTRVHRAEELLETTRLPITEIAQALRFGSVSYFNRIFKQHTNRTPMQYRSDRDGTIASRQRGVAKDRPSGR